MWLNGPSDEAKRAGGRLRPIRPVGAIRSHVRVQARPPPRARRVRGARHRDQRLRRRPLRDDRGGRRARGRRGAPRDLRLARAGGAPALARDPALHRDHAGHGRRRAAAGGGAGRARRPARGSRADRPQRALRRRGSCARRSSARGSTGPRRPRSAPCSSRAASPRSRASAALAPLAGSLGIEVDEVHRALPDALTCARVFCALFPKLCANAVTVGDALDLLRSRRRARKTEPGGGDSARPAAGPVDPAGRPGRLRLPRRARAAAVRGEVGVAALARAGALLCPRGLDRAGARSLTTGRPTRSSARSCSRTG